MNEGALALSDVSYTFDERAIGNSENVPTSSRAVLICFSPILLGHEAFREGGD